MHLQQTVQISRPPADVFDFLVDLHNHPRVASGIRAVHGAEDGPLTLGRRYQQTSVMLGQTLEATIEVTRFEPHRELCLQAVTGLVPVTRTFQLAADDHDGTEVTLAVEAEPGRGLRLMVPLIERTAREQIASTLQRLKEVLESETSPQRA